MSSYCERHPRYRVLRMPRAGCSVCWELWYRQNPDRLAFTLNSLSRALPHESQWHSTHHKRAAYYAMLAAARIIQP